MAGDDFKVEYHLTPNGWVVGSEYFFDKVRVERPIPADRIETWIRREYEPSPWSPTDVTWYLSWPSNGNPNTNKVLREKFGKPVRDFSGLTERLIGEHNWRNSPGQLRSVAAWESQRDCILQGPASPFCTSEGVEWCPSNEG